MRVHGATSDTSNEGAISLDLGGGSWSIICRAQGDGTSGASTGWQFDLGTARGTPIVLIQDASGADTAGIYVNEGSLGVTISAYGFDDSTGNEYDYYGDYDAVTLGSPFRVAISYDSVANLFRMAIDGADMTASDSPFGGGPPAPPAGGLALGAMTQINYLDSGLGEVGDIVVLDRALSAAELRQASNASNPEVPFGTGILFHRPATASGEDEVHGVSTTMTTSGGSFTTHSPEIEEILAPTATSTSTSTGAATGESVAGGGEIAGQASGAAVAAGTASGTVITPPILEGQASGGAVAAGTASGTVVTPPILEGQASGTAVAAGTATGTVVTPPIVEGQASGGAVAVGTASGTVVTPPIIEGQASGAAVAAGTATGSIVSPGIVEGQASGAAVAAGTASGTVVTPPILEGQASGGAVAAGTTTGSVVSAGVIEGQASGGAVAAGTATGTVITPPIVEGQALGAAVAAGTATGSIVNPATVLGQASGGAVAAGTATGSVVSPGQISGQASGTAVAAGTATGTVVTPPIVEGQASGGAVAAGAAAGSIFLAGQASSGAVAAGTATGTVVTPPVVEATANGFASSTGTARPFLVGVVDNRPTEGETDLGTLANRSKILSEAAWRLSRITVENGHAVSVRTVVQSEITWDAVREDLLPMICIYPAAGQTPPAYLLAGTRDEFVRFNVLIHAIGDSDAERSHVLAALEASASDVLEEDPTRGGWATDTYKASGNESDEGVPLRSGTSGATSIVTAYESRFTPGLQNGKPMRSASITIESSAANNLTADTFAAVGGTWGNEEVDVDAWQVTPATGVLAYQKVRTLKFLYDVELSLSAVSECVLSVRITVDGAAVDSSRRDVSVRAGDTAYLSARGIRELSQNGAVQIQIASSVTQAVTAVRGSLRLSPASLV